MAHMARGSTSEVIEEKLRVALAPHHLEVVDESHQHARGGQDSHFKLVLVSEQFMDVRLIQRHQVIYQLLAEELAAGVHALSMHLYTPSEWAAQGEAQNTPACRGGTHVGS